LLSTPEKLFFVTIIYISPAGLYKWSHPAIIDYQKDMKSRLTRARLVLAIISTAAEEMAIWVIWRFLLPEFDVYLHVGVLIGVMVAWGIFSVWLFIFTTIILKKQTPVGLPSMVGSRGKAASNLDPEGMVRIKGELWGATSKEGKISTGEEILVVGEDGLKLQVEKTGRSRSTR
jgi:membrane-bound ClpP family serine protease